jgi:hypothetical protein
MRSNWPMKWFLNLKMACKDVIRTGAQHIPERIWWVRGGRSQVHPPYAVDGGFGGDYATPNPRLFFVVGLSVV